MFNFIVMSGGLGKRMNSTTPKVLHLLNNKPLICYVLDSIYNLTCCDINKIIVVTGKYRSEIQETIERYYESTNRSDFLCKITFALQPEPLGTAHCITNAVQNEDLTNNESYIILSGDMPLISSHTIEQLMNVQNGILVSNKENPFGYGRVILNNDDIETIIEEKDSTDEQKLIQTVNCGVYIFSSEMLRLALPKITNDNNAKEYYLPDIVKYKISPIKSVFLAEEKAYEATGINTCDDLALAHEFI